MRKRLIEGVSANLPTLILCVYALIDVCASCVALVNYDWVGRDDLFVHGVDDCC